MAIPFLSKPLDAAAAATNELEDDNPTGVPEPGLYLPFIVGTGPTLCFGG